MTQTHPKNHIQVLNETYLVLLRWLILSRVQFTQTYQVYSQYNPYETCNKFSYVMHTKQMIFWYYL